MSPKLFNIYTFWVIENLKEFITGCRILPSKMWINRSMSTLVRLLMTEICPLALLWVMKRSEQMDGKLTIERNTALYLILKKY